MDIKWARSGSSYYTSIDGKLGDKVSKTKDEALAYGERVANGLSVFRPLGTGSLKAITTGFKGTEERKYKRLGPK